MEPKVGRTTAARERVHADHDQQPHQGGQEPLGEVAARKG